ncbi:MAG: hypothetical protein ACWA5A_00260 [Marinibacterium sp.]
MENAAILFVTVASLGLLFSRRIAGAPVFRATVTPLASIIGSGFLVLGPVLIDSYGGWAPAVMAGLCAVAYAFGWAIRFNILAIKDDSRSRTEQRLEALASWALAFAYFISVAYYLNLFGAFAVSLTTLDTPVHARQVTTATLVLVLVVGWTRGFSALEQMEQVTVSIKLAIIAGLLIGLAFYFAQSAEAGNLRADPAVLTGWPAIATAFGLIVTVQGFETSRYLGGAYGAELRVRSMKLAQWIATAIYMIYIGLLAYDFDVGQVPLSETAIIDMMVLVAPILPVLLVAAALSAQFSAAVADTAGAGGLVHELTRGHVPERLAYVLLASFGVVLTWAADVFQIIAYASRAFAAYYALQALIAAVAALRLGRPGRSAAFAGLALLGAAIAVFGVPVE